MKKYYAVNNRYGSSTSHGFGNTYFVLVFDSKKNRDAYVEDSPNTSANKINKKDIGRYIGRPKEFSGMCFLIYHMSDGPGIAGCIGSVVVDYPGNNGVNERLF